MISQGMVVPQQSQPIAPGKMEHEPFDAVKLREQWLQAVVRQANDGDGLDSKMQLCHSGQPMLLLILSVCSGCWQCLLCCLHQHLVKLNCRPILGSRKMAAALIACSVRVQLAAAAAASATAALDADLDDRVIVQVLLPPCGTVVGSAHPPSLRSLPVLWSSISALPSAKS